MNETWMIHAVTVASATGASEYGDPTFGSQRQVRCRIIERRSTVRRSDGTETDSGHELRTLEPIQLGDRIWLPGADTSSPDAAKTPASVELTHSKAGTSRYFKVLL